MRDLNDSTLWPSSDFERSLKATGTSGYSTLGCAALLPTTLLADLRRLAVTEAAHDMLEVVALCIRHRCATLLCVTLVDVICPVTLFPEQQALHSPHDLGELPDSEFAQLRVLATETAGVPAPTHSAVTFRDPHDHYRPLLPLLWRLALHGPRRRLLTDIAGIAAYRALRDPSSNGLPLAGASYSSMQRLRREAASVRDIANWPGMSVERACRLINALYLASSLIITRTHPSARQEPAALAPARRS